MMQISNLILVLVIINFSSGEYLNAVERTDLRGVDWEEIVLALGKNNERDADDKCLESFGNYVEGIKTGQQWALYMLDSSAKIPDGILKGNSYALGQFDECLDETQNENFTGQFCMADITIELSTGSKKNSYRSMFPNPYSEPFASTTNINLHYGICVPSTCTAEYLTTAINSTLSSSEKFALIKSFSFSESNCATTKSKELSTGFWVVIAFFIVIIVIALASTAYEIRQCKRGNDKPHPLLTSFSLYKNGKFLFKVSSGDGQMLSLHGMRSLSIAWVVLGHAYFNNLFSPVVNMADIVDIVQDINRIFIVNAIVSVDSFFLLSGLLVCFVFFRDVGRKGGYDVLLGYIHRYLRLTPLYAVMILLVVTIFEYLGDGPLWNSLSTPFINYCKDNWHYGLLYVQNYLSPTSLCLGQSWYLAADMQMFWVAPFFLYPMLLLPPTIGAGFICVIILMWMGLTAGLDYVNESSPNLFLSPGPDQFSNEYVVAYTRAGPWLIGLALGYLIAGIKANKIKIKLSKVQVALGWICSTAICLGVLYGIKPFLELPTTRSQAEMTAYMVLHRLGWSLGLSWVIFACVAGYGGPVNTFLSWGIFQPLGKLSYCVFLIHMTIQQFRMGRLRTNVYIGDVDIVYSFLADYMLANLLSIPFVLLFEIPIANLDRYFFGNVEIFRYPRKNKKDLILSTKKKGEEKTPKLSLSNPVIETERPNMNVISVLDIDKDLNNLENKQRNLT